jgi:hypothetical protein
LALADTEPQRRASSPKGAAHRFALKFVISITFCITVGEAHALSSKLDDFASLISPLISESHVDAALEHQFFDMAGAQRIREIPAHPHEHDVLRKMGALEADHLCSPSLGQSRFRRKSIPEIVYG